MQLKQTKHSRQIKHTHTQRKCGLSKESGRFFIRFITIDLSIASQFRFTSAAIADYEQLLHWFCNSPYYCECYNLFHSVLSYHYWFGQRYLLPQTLYTIFVDTVPCYGKINKLLKSIDRCEMCCCYFQPFGCSFSNSPVCCRTETIKIPIWPLPVYFAAGIDRKCRKSVDNKRCVVRRDERKTQIIHWELKCIAK